MQDLAALVNPPTYDVCCFGRDGFPEIQDSRFALCDTRMSSTGKELMLAAIPGTVCRCTFFSICTVYRQRSGHLLRVPVYAEQPVVDRKLKLQEESESFLLSDDRKEKLPVRDADKDQILKRMNDMCSLVGSLQPPFGT